MKIIDPKLKNHEGFLKKIFEIAIDQRKYFFRNEICPITKMERLIFNSVSHEQIDDDKDLPKAILQSVMRNYKWDLNKLFKAANSPTIDLWSGKDVINLEQDKEPEEVVYGINAHMMGYYFEKYYFNDEKDVLKNYEIPSLKKRIKEAIRLTVCYLVENELFRPLPDAAKFKGLDQS